MPPSSEDIREAMRGVDRDEEFKELAFAQYRIEHGIHESVRLGDLPRQAVSEVLDRAQKLKTKEAK
jgi:hypothetical protein